MLKEYGFTQHDMGMTPEKAVLEPPTDKPGWTVLEIHHDGKAAHFVLVWEREIVSDTK